MWFFDWFRAHHAGTSLPDKNIQPETQYQKLAFIYDADRDDIAKVAQAAATLRERGFAVVSQARKKDMKKQIDQLSNQKITALCIFKGDVQNLEIKPL